MNAQTEHPERSSLVSIIQPILQEDRGLRLTARDIALLVMMQHEIRTNPAGLLTLPYSVIQSLSSRLDLIDVKDEVKAERRLSESVSRLLADGCLSRADMSRLKIDSDAEYQLTSLGESVAEWHEGIGEFSGEPLTAIFRAFIGQLSKIAEEAEKAFSEDVWHVEVTLQTQHVLRDMLINIQRHQKDLDKQHAELREFIPTLLTSGEDKTIERCEQQLNQVIKTMEDLQEVVLSSSSVTFSLIDNIEAFAKNRAFHGFIPVSDDIFRRLQSIQQWTTQRAIDWFEHHNVVHNFLRTVIRVDRQRRITNALKRAIAGVPGWTLEVGDEPPFIRMRGDIQRMSPSKAPPRVPKDSQPRQREYVEVEPDDLPNILVEIFSRSMEESGEALASHVFSDATKQADANIKLVPHFPWLMGVMVNAGKLDPSVRNWTAVVDDFEIEELRVIKK